MNAVLGEYRPAEIRAMIPKDLMLIHRAHRNKARAKRPGANAPSRRRTDELEARYPDEH